MPRKLRQIIGHAPSVKVLTQPVFNEKSPMVAVAWKPHSAANAPSILADLPEELLTAKQRVFLEALNLPVLTLHELRAKLLRKEAEALRENLDLCIPEEPTIFTKQGRKLSKREEARLAAKSREALLAVGREFGLDLSEHSLVTNTPKLSQVTRLNFFKILGMTAAWMALWREAVAIGGDPASSGAFSFGSMSCGSSTNVSMAGGAGFGKPLPHWNITLMQQQQMPNWCWAAVVLSLQLFYDPTFPITTQCALVNAVFVELDEAPFNCCTGSYAKAYCDKYWNVDNPFNTVLQITPTNVPDGYDGNGKADSGLVYYCAKLPEPITPAQMFIAVLGTTTNATYDPTSPDQGYPIVVRFGWIFRKGHKNYNDHGGNVAFHYAVIWGCYVGGIYTADNPRLTILDPWWGKTFIKLSAFPTEYFTTKDPKDPAPSEIKWYDTIFTRPNYTP